MDTGLAYAISVLAGLLAGAREENDLLRQHLGIPPGMPTAMFLAQVPQGPEEEQGG